jgi:superfamily II DNA or RNA helicase
MIRPESLPASWLSRVTDSGAWSRGRRYFREGQARVVELNDLGDDAIELLGLCHGSSPQPYRQDVEIRRDRNGYELLGQCSCPVGYNCKHVVALVLAWQAAAPRSGPARDPIADWLSEQPGTETEPEPAKEGLLYVFGRPARYRDTGNIQLSLYVARRRKDGSWSKGRSLTPSAIGNWWHRPGYLDPLDDGILGMIRTAYRSSLHANPMPEGSAGRTALINMIETGRAFWEDERSEPLRPGPPRPLQIAWSGDQDAGYRLEIDIEGGGELVPVHPPCYIDPGRLEAGVVEVPHGLDGRQVQWLLDAPEIPGDAARHLSRRLLIDAPGLPTPVDVELRELDVEPRGALTVNFDPARPDRAIARFLVCYDDLILSVDHPETNPIVDLDDDLIRLNRDRDAEQRLAGRLVESGLRARDEQYFDLDDDRDDGRDDRRDLRPQRDAWLDWLQHRATELDEEGWIIELTGDSDLRIRNAGEIDGDVESDDNEWFSLRFDLDIDGRKLPLVPLISQLLENYRPGALPDSLYLEADEGHFVRIPADRIEPILQTVLELSDRVSDNALKLSRPDAGRLLDLEGIPVRGGTAMKNLARKLSDFSGLAPAKLPTTFKGDLRNYQQHGVDWLQFLREHGFGGILADDMGLGKTVQTLAHLAVEKRAGRMQHPSLIVAPTSLMGNWQREAALFTPNLEVLVLHGPDRAQHFDTLADYDLVLTTYPLLPRDRAVLLAQPWHLLILDEAQQIKNPRAQAAQVARKLDCRHRLALTGTPMENHLGELWAQFDILMPGFLGEQKNFNRTYRTPIEKHNDSDRLERLQRRIAPFLLRRTKDRVAAELPPKTELIRTAEFDAKQARLYESVRLTMEKKVRQAIADKGLAKSHIIVLDALMKLRQVCCDPRLLPKGTRGAAGTPSAKFSLLFDLLPELLEEGRRILLFSQFTTMLGLIERELDRRSITYTKLTGQTRKREQAIERFRSGETNLFLISLRAGGVGLNLVEADTVIHYDPWWNPAVEHQATDRAHRIGQDKPVFVYKLITEGTVEEKILALQKRKHELAQSVVGKGREKDQPPIDEDIIRDLLAANRPPHRPKACGRPALPGEGWPRRFASKLPPTGESAPTPDQTPVGGRLCRANGRTPLRRMMDAKARKGQDR